MTKRNKFLLIFILIFSLIINNLYCEKNFKILSGSNLYMRIFFFFFPISNKYEYIFQEQDDLLILDITLKKENIKNEPSTQPLFETDLNIKLQNVPINKSGKSDIPISIRCNKKVGFKNVDFTIYRNDNILILKGCLDNLSVNEISDNEYFKKRFKWKYPIYFDIRIRISENN
ncbi:MAG: hypothetical protein A2Y34_00070 [Spirochaetes bacterium GWC1_27_15]|nr:MAG: hypothetical protein A2Z98_09850 [Spirochaetes bacterium GWB1_27_13]OHD25351.1 MAG: hypothetical protein A2Y34_00070 [Spirochaetes bacterium GWC1_27_15]